MAKRMTFGDVLDFLDKIEPKVAGHIGEDWAEHVQQLSAVIAKMMEEEDISRKEPF